MNFYSYADNRGMQYHPDKDAAKKAVDHAIREFIHNNVTDPAILGNCTWGEVRERAASVDGNAPVLRNQLRLSYEAAHPQVIDGRMVNGNEDLVLIRNIHEEELMYHDLVLGVAAIWKDLSAKIGRFKQHNFEDVTTVLDLLFEKYEVKRGGKQGNMQFFSFDRKFKLSIAIQNKIDFGPELQAAERKLTEALDEMAANEGSDLKTLVGAAFNLDAGKIRVAEILRLRSYKIENVLWNEAMQIINKALIVISSKRQIRLHERTAAGEYVNIPLDIAAL